MLIPPHVTKEIKRLCDELLGPRPQGRWVGEERPEDVLHWYGLYRHLHARIADHPHLHPKDHPWATSVYGPLRRYAEEWVRLLHAPPSPPSTRAYVYFIRAEGGLVKIGRTIDVPVRLAELQAVSPVTLELLHIVGSDEPRKLEARFHRRFRDKRVRGEWFALTEHDIRTRCR